MFTDLPPYPIPVPVKVCVRCKHEKPLSDFDKSARCFSCREYNQKWRAENRERVSKYNRQYCAKNRDKTLSRYRKYRVENADKRSRYDRGRRETIEGRAVTLFNAARTRRSEGFTLTLAHVLEGLKRGYCAATGIPFVLKTGGGRRHGRSPFAPSIDKIDPKKSYTNENTRIVIWQYNAMKFELSDSELLSICKIIVAKAES